MRRIRIALAAVAVTTAGLAVDAAPAHAATTHFTGIGYVAGPETDCTEPGSLFTIEMTGGLDGCWYTAETEAVERPSGVYQETGREWFVGCLVEDGVEVACGTFETTYRFTAKFTAEGQQHGRCQHPLAAGTGTEGFDGATGRVDFKDDVDAGNFRFRGFVKLAQA